MKTIRNLLLSVTVALGGSVFPAGAQEDAGGLFVVKDSKGTRKIIR